MAEQETYLGAWVERLQEEVAILEARAERLQGALEEISQLPIGETYRAPAIARASLDQATQ